MLIGMICQIFIVPALFVVFQSLQERSKPLKWDDDEANHTIDSELAQYTKPCTQKVISQIELR